MEFRDLKKQYQLLKGDIDQAMTGVAASGGYIMGSAVKELEQELAEYTCSKHVITCANGTDALRLALMALDLQLGDEVVTVPFTFVSTIEVIALLGLKPVLVDVCPDTFNMDVSQLESVITPKTKAIIPVHLFGQCADMERILAIARAHNLFVVEDACQAIGAEVTFSDGSGHQAGTMGDVGCTSFFPSKNLGCFGDGGALFTQKEEVAAKIRSMANHGMSRKYYYERVGMNSRLDTLQAAVLQVKLRHLDEYTAARRHAAGLYNTAFRDVAYLQTPAIAPYTTHVYHQYTLKVLNNKRDELKEYLDKNGITSMIYYPIPLNRQEAFTGIASMAGDMSVSDKLSSEVLSLPIHTEMNLKTIHYISTKIREFFSK